jgi:methylenetetrahydrofolate dehydrogenase (NADP+)/methenyltetrahydrofolate cyclohydrolase
MTAQLIDGRAVANKVHAEVQAKVAAFVHDRGRAPTLHLVLVGDDGESQRHVRNKQRASQKVGISAAMHELPADGSQAALLAQVEALNRDPHCDAILVQLPLPAQIDQAKVIASIDPRKDVDGITPTNAGLLALGRPGLAPCTALGCLRLLDEVGCELRGKRALVIGRGLLVGRPTAQLLLTRDATLIHAHSHTRELGALVAGADVIIAAAGRAGLVRGSDIKPGALVIDAGLNRDAAGKLCGDVEFEAAQARAAFITPVPGGVGPMTVAMLLANTISAASARG